MSLEQLIGQGRDLIMSGKFEEAVTKLTEAIGISPENTKAHSYRAFAYDELGEYREARKDLTKVIEHEPDNAIAYVYKGRMSIQLQEFDQAVANLEKAKKLSPTSPTIYFYLGKSMEGLGNKEEAKANYNYALKLVIDKKMDSRNPDDYFTAISAEERLISMGVGITPIFKNEAMERGIRPRTK